MLEVSNLYKNYGNVAAVKDLSFSVSKGEVFGFLGPNGAGKTTTMKIITGFLPMSQGRVNVAGMDIIEQD
jgi:ABC-2 type transport system ATP-binding protein